MASYLKPYVLALIEKANLVTVENGSGFDGGSISATIHVGDAKYELQVEPQVYLHMDELQSSARVNLSDANRRVSIIHTTEYGNEDVATVIKCLNMVRSIAIAHAETKRDTAFNEFKKLTGK